MRKSTIRKIKAEKQLAAASRSRKTIYKAKLGDGYFILGAISPEDAQMKALLMHPSKAHIVNALVFQEASNYEKRLWAGSVCLCDDANCGVVN
jgi:hypothetical protein